MNISKMLSFFSKLEIAYALKKSLQTGYSQKDFTSDLLAGIVVAIVAIPLNMGLAIATGVPPEMGLYTAIVAGFIVALLGGSAFQVTGPTAAFVVILLPIVGQFGVGGLMTAGLMAGIIIFVMGITGIGRMVQFIPSPVTMGLTTGIGLVIFTIQIKDFMGFTLAHSPESFFERISLYWKSIDSFSPQEFIISILTLLGLIFIPKIEKVRKLPAPIIVIPLITILVEIINKSGYSPLIQTIESKFLYQKGGEILHGIPTGIFSFNLPWNFVQEGANIASHIQFNISFSTIKSLLIPSFAIAILATLESLLSAVIADSMGKTKHSSKSELMALGIGNILTSLFNGIPATGALARTSTNIRFGAKSPVAAMTHSLIMLLVLLFFSSTISKLPLASLAALLMIVAYNMSDLDRFFHLFKIGPMSDKIILVSCFASTVVFDMVIGIIVGIQMAAILFIKRTIELGNGEFINPEKINSILNNKITNNKEENLSKNILIYQIKGPLFFGVADKIISQLEHEFSLKNKKGIIILMDHVPSMDVTGLLVFQNLLSNLKEIPVVLVGLTSWTQDFLKKTKIILPDPSKNKVFSVDTLEEGATLLMVESRVKSPIS